MSFGAADHLASHDDAVQRIDGDQRPRDRLEVHDTEAEAVSMR